MQILEQRDLGTDRDRRGHAHDAIVALRRLTSKGGHLERIALADWARKGTHTELGSYGVEDWLRIYADHCHDHAAQIRVASQR
ncbi:MAG: hypothetical protein ACR2MZ_10930 [Candidatus Dormibacter sp.]|uniref:hypothetical protein n=1 Tax=Candidatus Dormibacter sp. TaxID=2973982 RepID=UPI003D9B355F